MAGTDVAESIEHALRGKNATALRERNTSLCQCAHAATPNARRNSAKVAASAASALALTYAWLFSSANACPQPGCSITWNPLDWPPDARLQASWPSGGRRAE